MGIIKVVLTVGILLGSAGGGFGLGLYVADYEVQATIVDKQCAGPTPPGFDDAPGADRPDQDDAPSEPPSQDDAQPDPAATDLPAAGENSTVTIRARAIGVAFEVDVDEFPNDKCWPLRDGKDGNFVTVNIRTKKAVFFEREGGTCIFHTIFGPGCILPDAVEDAAGMFASANYVLSTNGYVDLPVTAIPNSAPNCLVFDPTGATEMTINATWQPGAIDDTLRMVVELSSDGADLERQDLSGPPTLSTTIEIPPEATSLMLRVLPDGEPIGTTSTIHIDIGAFGITSIPEPGAFTCGPGVS